ncbi:FAD-dependent monooxygenase [Microbispora corallina]|uniref:FAD-dependent oxidoreductase n=1 Tax=Microbispora corallina TaxID=83302 RepID=A0ABQ4FWD0_9ACTN|nr:FAD-dependent monooxygenase [Microbispora corallina]GIH39077.1 FAD-dependent oxidoreductase [Microbispora corallina]
MDVDVVVAGAGPVGLMLACELRLGGASVQVLERRADRATALKAGAMGARSVNAPTADAFRRRGLLDEVRRAALMWFEPGGEPDTPPEEPVFVGHFAGIPIRADLLDPADPDLAAYTLGGGAISQLDLETILEARALALGAAVRRGVALTDLEADAEGVTAVTEDGPIRAGWLVGCDGGRSTVRRRAGIAFPGTDAEFAGRQAMVEFADPARLPLGDWVRTERGAYVHGPVPGRIHTVEYGPVPAAREAPVTAEEMNESLRRIAGIDAGITAVRAGTRYTDATRQAATYRAGRVLLAGDAAHIHSPAGGQGMNLGLGDAVNLGWKLAAAVRGWAPDGLLDSYTAERHPIGAWVQGWSDAQTALGRPDGRTAALRAVVADLLGTRPAATYVVKQISGLGRGYGTRDGHPLAGRLAPDLPLDDGTTLSARCEEARFLLVTRDPRLRELAAPYADRLTVLPGPGDLLVRPDGYVAGGDAGDLTPWLGLPSTRAA